MLQKLIVILGIIGIILISGCLGETMSERYCREKHNSNYVYQGATRGGFCIGNGNAIKIECSDKECGEVNTG